MSEGELKSDIDEQIETFIKSNSSSQLTVRGPVLKGAIYNDSSRPKTKWDDIIAFQAEWKSKLRSNIVIYFNELPMNVSLGTKKIFNRNKLIFKKKFQLYNTTISPIFNERVNLVIVDSYQNVKPMILPYKKNLKIWDFNKTTQFFNRMDIKVPQLIDLEKDQLETRYDDIQYYDNDPYVYLFDKLQLYKPIICKHWDQTKFKDVSYPKLYINSYGRCPFQKEDIDENHRIINNDTYLNRIRKRYCRDELNKRYALKLKRLYRFHASIRKTLTDQTSNYISISTNHDCLDSKKLFDVINKVRLKRTKTNFKFMSFNEYDSRENLYNGFSRNPENDLISLPEYYNKNSNSDNYNNDSDNSSQDTLETVLSSDAKLSSLDVFEARTDLQKCIDASGFYSINESSKYFYCENCKTKFSSLKAHRDSNSHASFADNDLNFYKIDEFIKRLHGLIQ
ncbi:uncharacterized protein PWA37_005301 [Arxiozyma heterogenica]|uniref:uncharacterized protein n=1 Tax=Arxiozyma heterogenica TaxID=278026 RepID=UPI002EE6A661